MRIILTEVRTKHGLSVIRNLGRRGLHLICSDHMLNPSFSSKYCSECFIYSKEKFLEDLKCAIRKHRANALIPIGYESTILTSMNKEELQAELEYEIPVVPWETMSKVVNKEKLLDISDRIGVSPPRTRIFSDVNGLEEIEKYPVVVKSTSEKTGLKKVEYANSKNELREILSRRVKVGKQIVQEYVRGFGAAFFALYWRGRMKVYFMHRRVREYPYYGGVSSCAESYWHEDLLRRGKRLLDHLNWHGIAMVEFRFDLDDEEFKLMELNPKFWGSLDLAIESGVEFPYLLTKCMGGEEIRQPRYRFKKFQWLLSEDVWRIRTSPNPLESAKEMLTDLLDFSTEKDLKYIGEDPLPTIGRVIYTLMGLIGGKSFG